MRSSDIWNLIAFDCSNLVAVYSNIRFVSKLKMISIFNYLETLKVSVLASNRPISSKCKMVGNCTCFVESDTGSELKLQSYHFSWNYLLHIKTHQWMSKKMHWWDITNFKFKNLIFGAQWTNGGLNAVSRKIN